MIKVENIVQEIQNPVCVNSGNSRNYLENIHILGIPNGIPGIIWRISIFLEFPMGFLEFPDFFEKFPEFRDSLGISGGVRSTGF